MDIAMGSVSKLVNGHVLQKENCKMLQRTTLLYLAECRVHTS